MAKLKIVGTVSADSVRKHTKMDWDEWVTALNKRASRSWSHQELVALLKNEFRLRAWWQQEVARGYLIAIGVREPQQTLKGTYTTTATKSLPTALKKVFSFIVSPEGQKNWLQPMYAIRIAPKGTFECDGGIFGEFRAVTTNKKIRLNWIDPDWPRKTVVEVNLYAKPKGKCMIVINHTDLPTLSAKAKMHARWRSAVDEIAIGLGSLDT